MGLFRKQRSAPTPLKASPADLAAIGFDGFGHGSPYAGVPFVGLLDEYVIYAQESANYPNSGTSEYDQLLDHFLNDLAAAAEQTPPWGVVGAAFLAWNFTTDADRLHPVFLSLLDGAIAQLRAAGVPPVAIPPFLNER